MATYDLNKDNTIRYAKEDKGKPSRIQPYTNKYKQLRNAEIRRNSLLQGRTQELVIQYQLSVLKTYIQYYVIDWKDCIYEYLCVTTINKKEAWT